MKKKKFTVLGLFVLLAGLAAVYLFIQIGGDTEPLPPQPQAPSHQMTMRSPSEITYFYITNAHGMISLAQNENGAWIGTAQFIHLDQSMIRALAADFVNPHIEMRLDNVQLAEYGLEPPLRTVEVYYADGGIDILHIGHMTPDGQFYYVRLEGNDHVYLISRTTGNRYLWAYENIVVRDMPFFDPDLLINAALAERGKEPILITPNFAVGIVEGIPPGMAFVGNAGLTMVSPLNGRRVWASNFIEFVVVPASNIRLSGLASLSVDHLYLYGLDEPLLDIFFEYVDIRAQAEDSVLPSRVWRLRIGNLTGDYFYALYDGIPHVFKAHRDMIAPLLELDILRFTDRLVHLTNIGSVHSIRIAGHDRVYDIQLNHGQIDLDGTAALDINPTINGISIQERSFIDLYQMLIGITYEHMIELTIPQEAPELSITFNTFDADNNLHATTSYFYRFDNSFYAVRSETEEAVRFLTSRQALNHMFRYVYTILANE